MATLVTVLKSGGRYDGVWVERLARGIRRFAPGFRRIVCLTDLPLAIDGVETMPLREGWPGWWSKMEAFRPGLFEGTVLLCDLDTVFTGNAGVLAERGLAAMEDHFLKGRVSSALLRWEGSELGFVFEAFAADPARWQEPGSCGTVPNAVHGDQVVIDTLLRRANRMPPFFQTLHPGLLDFHDPGKADPGPVVIFIGDAKPDRAGPAMERLWRGDAGDAGEPLAKTDRPGQTATR